MKNNLQDIFVQEFQYVCKWVKVAWYLAWCKYWLQVNYCVNCNLVNYSFGAITTVLTTQSWQHTAAWPKKNTVLKNITDLYATSSAFWISDSRSQMSKHLFEKCHEVSPSTSCLPLAVLIGASLMPPLLLLVLTRDSLLFLTTSKPFIYPSSTPEEETFDMIWKGEVFKLTNF